MAKQNRSEPEGQSAGADSSGEIAVAEEGDAAIPLAFVDPPPELIVTEEQLTEFNMLRQQFAESMGGPDADPAAPDYRRRWEDAQALLDEQFMAFFGLEAFNQQQIKAVREAGQRPARCYNAWCGTWCP